MPVGGIGTGQLYLCGDGTLGLWEIFNHHHFHGHGPRNYAPRTIPRPVNHGLAVAVQHDGKTVTRLLDATGFPDITFRGEYPVGTVRYSGGNDSIEVTLEVFSPFVPLNAKDSALPATVFMVTVENTGETVADASVLSWLENPVARSAAEKGWRGIRTTRVERENGGGRIVHAARSVPEEAISAPERSVIVFENFEGPDYGDWKVEGTAFGDGPASGTLPTQSPVGGFQGKGLINTFIERDQSQGTLLSPEFEITRRYINFLLGGGNHHDLGGMRLIIDGEAVRTATGENSETLIWHYWDVSEFEGRKAQLEIFDQVSDGWGHVLVDQIEFADRARAEHDYATLEAMPDFGTMVWSTPDELASGAGATPAAAELREDVRSGLSWEESAEFPLSERRTAAMAVRPVPLQPGEKKTFTFVLTWHFPNTVRPDREAGHEYAARFSDAGAVADYVLEHRERLAADTRKWRDTWYDSTLPVWLLDRIFWPTTCLATGTVQWWKNDRFWAWEGVVCCEGTCTHVWNYSQTLARIFPELERSVRERQDLDVGLEPSGLVGFRHNGHYAADGQCGTVLKVWREHQMSPDNGFLSRNWANTRRVMEYLIEQDGNGDGLIENSQHNTYDIDFYGANTFVGALYLGALRAAEEMAREMGDDSYADRLHRIYESGRRLTEERLWDGEYFIQEVDLDKHPKDQYGPGCLSDQMFGQNWAHQTGLGYIYDPAKVRKALESVWKYNWAPETGVYNARFPPERPYTDAIEPGLFICTWPKSRYLKEGVRYREEVWTGIEYQVASHMIEEGMLEEGLAICRAVHDRYHPMKRNPYNEVECSDFYSRAMASYGVLQALSGYRYHGPKAALAFAPRLKPEDFRAPFTTAEGWGTFEQKLSDDVASWKLNLRHGILPLNELRLEAPAEIAGELKVSRNGQPVETRATRAGKQVTITFEDLTLEQNQSLEISMINPGSAGVPPANA